jgi:MFS family permease
MSRADGLGLSILFYIIVGIGAAAIWVPIVTMIQHWFGEKRRGLALGILSPSYGIGFGLMGLVLPFIVLKYDWRFGWSLLGIAGLFLLFLNGMLLRNRPEEMGLSPWGETAEGKMEIDNLLPPKIGYFEILKMGRFWLIGLSYSLISYGAYTMVDFVVTYGVMELILPYQIASLFITVIAFSGVIGGIFLMALSDTIGRKKSLMIIESLVATGTLFVIFVGNRVPLLMVGLGCFGFAYGAIWPMYGACARDYFPKEITGAVFGLMTIFYGVGGMISPILTGRLADATGTFRWSFGLGAVTALFAAFLLVFLKRPMNSKEEKN